MSWQWHQSDWTKESIGLPKGVMQKVIQAVPQAAGKELGIKGMEALQSQPSVSQDGSSAQVSAPSAQPSQPDQSNMAAPTPGPSIIPSAQDSNPASFSQQLTNWVQSIGETGSTSPSTSTGDVFPESQLPNNPEIENAGDQVQVGEETS